MSSRNHPQAIDRRSPAVAAHLLGVIDYEACLALQQRLVYEAAGDTTGAVTLLVAEHAQLITVGRLGSRAHIRLPDRELKSRQIAVRWVNRGGGCVLHLPGQLAVYPIIPLEPHGFSVGEFMRRFERGLLATLHEVGVAAHPRPGWQGLWTRGGQVAAFGTAVKDWTTYHGAYVNVCPPMPLYRHVVSDPVGRTRMTSLLLERGQPVKMTRVREGLIRHLTESFGCDRYHLYTGHPLLARSSQIPSQSIRRVG